MGELDEAGLGESASSGLPADGPDKVEPDADAILAMLAATRAAASSRSSRSTNLLVATSLIVVVLVIGIIFGALYLKHTAGNDGLSTAPASARVSVAAALSTAKMYVAQNGYPALVADPVNLFQLLPAGDDINLGTVSASDTEVALYAASASAVVFVALQNQTCYGVVDVFTEQASPVFRHYPATVNPGVYYFAASLTAPGTCSASVVTPPGGAQFVSTAGWPSATP